MVHLFCWQILPLNIVKRLYEIEQEHYSEDYQWTLNRRRWLQTALLGGLALSAPWVTSCETMTDNTEPNLDGAGIFTHVEMKTIYALQNFLLPVEGIGPSASAMNAHQYFVWSLGDQHIPNPDKEYFINKTTDFIKLCKEQTTKSFHDLDEKEKENFILNNRSESWFESYLSRMITVIFEATLLDPIYGGNTNEEGWNWLEHIPGSPRPDEDTKYPEILTKLKPQTT